MTMERSPLHKNTVTGAHRTSTLYLRREGDGERFDLFVLRRVLGDGGSSVCYEALLADEKKVGRLKEFYPIGASYPFSLTRTAENHIVSTEKHRAFAHAVDEFLTPYRLLRSLQGDSVPDLAGFIPDFSIYFPCTADGTPIENGTVYIWTAPENMLVFDSFLAQVHRTPTKDPERTLYTILRAIQSLTECVRILHAQGLLHLDIKPANFGIPRRGERLLTDSVSLFDINSIQSLSGRDLVCHATKGFAAPELLHGAPSNRSDIYAIGCTLFSAIVVHRDVPRAQGYHASYYHSLPRLVADSALLRASEINENVFLQWELVRILEKCLAPHESQRYRSCGELLADLEQVCNRLLASYTPNPTAPLPARAVLERRLGNKQGPGAHLSLLYHLYKHPLYTCTPADRDRLSVLIVGCGGLGQRFLDYTLQLAQDCGKRLTVRVLSADQAAGKQDQELYLMHRPALSDFFSVDGSGARTADYGELQFSHAEFMPGDRIQNTALARTLLRSEAPPDYVFIALGDDGLSRSVAQAFAAAARGVHSCQIHYAHMGAPVQKTDRITPLNLAASFTDEPAFRLLEQMALAAHICWKNGVVAPISELKREFRSPYYYLSSLTNAVSVKYKLHALGISLSEPTEAARAFRALLAQEGKPVLGRLAASEHRRWVTEKLCEGWTPLADPIHSRSHRDLRKKQHACLVHSTADLQLQSWELDRWDTASEAEVSALDPLDQLSVRRHRFFSEQASGVRASVSPRTMYPILQLRELTASEPACATAFFEWYTCLSLLWDGDSAQAQLYTALSQGLLELIWANLPQSKETAEKLLALIAEQVAPILQSLDFSYYKQHDIALVAQIPFLLTYRTDLHLAVPLQAGSRSAHFGNVTACTACHAAQITYLFPLETPDSLSALRDALHFVAGYLRAHRQAPTVNLLLPHRLDRTPEAELSALRTDLQALGMRCRSITCPRVQEVSQLSHTVLCALQRKRTPVLLERNGTPLSDLLFAAGVYHSLPHYRFDADTRSFCDTVRCDHLAYIKTNAYLHASDLFPVKHVTGQTAVLGGYLPLWQKLYRPQPHIWRALCRLLRTHCANADTVATVPLPKGGLPTQTRRILLPVSAFSGAEQVVADLCRLGVLDAASAVRYHSAEVCAVSLTAPSETLQPLVSLFARPHLFLRADALTVASSREQVQIRFDGLLVEHLDLTRSSVSAEALAALLMQLAEPFSLLTAFRTDKTGTLCSFTFATKAVKALLTAEERLVEAYIEEACRRSRLFDDIASADALCTEARDGAKEFALLITKGFSSLFVDVKSADGDIASCCARLAHLAKTVGIRTTPVLVTEDAVTDPTAQAAGTVILAGDTALEQIAEALAHLC